MSSTCNTCGQNIVWDKKRREQLGWKGPLNSDLSKHMCYSSGKQILVQEEKPPMNDTSKVDNSVLIVAISQLTDAVNNLTLAHLASTEEERNRIKERITI